MKNLAPCLEHTDILFANQDEARMLAGTGARLEAAPALAARGVRVVVLKLGAQGCRVFANGAAFHCPAFAVNAVDTTGAGDCFAGDLLSALAAVGWRTRLGWPMPSPRKASCGRVPWRSCSDIFADPPLDGLDPAPLLIPAKAARRPAAKSEKTFPIYRENLALKAEPSRRVEYNCLHTAPAIERSRR